jgi:hypothetical protein
MHRMPPVLGSMATMLPTLLVISFSQFLEFDIKAKDAYSGRRWRRYHKPHFHKRPGYGSYYRGYSFEYHVGPSALFHKTFQAGKARIVAHLVTFIFMPPQKPGIYFAI